LLGTTIFSGFVTLKYFFHPKITKKQVVNNRIYLAAVLNLSILLTLKWIVFQKGTFYGPWFLLWFVVLTTFLDVFFVYLYYALVRSRTIGLDVVEDIEKKRQEAQRTYNPVSQTKSEIVQNFIGKRIFNWIDRHVDIESNKTNIFSTFSNLNIELLPRYSTDAIINLRKVNDIRRFNLFFEYVNEKLPENGTYIGMVETIECRNSEILKKTFFPVNYLLWFFDFIVNRVLPKIKLTQELYFSYTEGENRAISKAEALGRLYSCGFELIDSTVINNRFWFYIRKVKNPIYDNNPTYGPFVALRRIGKDRKIVQIYKLRTMYPYSEYIQKYVYDQQGTSNGDKAENDFRITGWGHFFRKFWLDELPMFINLIKGDVKMVGVRPLSKTKFDTYPPELQDKRTRTRPGLVPPFYADMPKTQEELFSSEDRYLDAYFQSPFKTDVRYFFKAFYNIVVKKARSK
jgi:lipopolysaccharide/colanic/teichoic acid biosynthesis glycosyltransferase